MQWASVVCLLRILPSLWFTYFPLPTSRYFFWEFFFFLNIFYHYGGGWGGIVETDFTLRPREGCLWPVSETLILACRDWFNRVSVTTHLNGWGVETLSERFWEKHPHAHLGEQLEKFPFPPDTVAGGCEVWTGFRCSCFEGSQAGVKDDTRRRAEPRESRGAVWVRGSDHDWSQHRVRTLTHPPRLFFGLRHLSQICSFWASVATNGHAFRMFSPGLLFSC